MSKFDWFLWILHSTLLRACADQLSYNLSLIKLCSAFVKQNTAVKTAIDAFSLLTKETFSDIVGEHPSWLIINFEQVVFSYQWLIALFTRVLLRVIVYYYHVTYAFQSESTLYSFRTSWSKQAQYLKLKWMVTYGNRAVQT